jgi:hypothetical protein
MTARRARVTLASLVEDFTLYPRGTVNDGHVRDLRRALEAGGTLPLMVVEAGTLRVVDGFHRRRALAAHLGADATVSVELRSYDSELELFRDAAALNATHGQPLDRDDQVRVAVRMRELGAADDEIALTLRVTEARIGELLVHLTARTSGGEQVALKPSIRHLAGRTLTARQEQGQPRVTGTATLRLVRDLRDRLRFNLMDLDSPKVREGLEALVEEVRRALDTYKAPTG